MRTIGILAIAILASLAASDARAAGEENEAKGEAQPRYVALPPVSVPLVRGSALHGRFFVRFELAVASEAAEAEVGALKPRLEAAYLESLSLLAQHHLDPAQAVDMGLLRALLQRTTDRVLEPGTARVLVQEAAFRR